MTTFDLTDVRRFAADLEDRMDRCDNGEGMECANLDATLRHYANLSCEFREGVRAWGRSVFAGRVPFDPEVEKVLREEGDNLWGRATELLAYGQQAEVPCYILDGQAALRSALWGLAQLLEWWVTPQLSVSPSARQGSTLTGPALEAAQEQVAALPPLPADWHPADPRQQARFKKIRIS